MIPIDFAIFLVMCCMCFFQVNPESRINPKNFVDCTSSRVLPSIWMLIFWLFSFLGGPKTIVWVLSTFNDSLLARNQSMSKGISLFNKVSIVRRSGPEEKTFESSANIIVDILFEIVPRSLIYIRNKMGPRIEPWGTPQVMSEVDDILPL